jgi:PAS domain S-box-containing protein
MKQKRAEESLRLLESAVEQMNDALVVTTAEGDAGGPRIVFVGPAFTRMLGYARDEVIGRHLDLLAGPETDRARADLARATVRAGGVATAENVNYRKDGTPISVEWRVAPVSSADGHVTHFVAVLRDITQRREAEEATARLTQGLENAARQWRETFDAIESPIFLLDKDVRILRMNEASRRLAGGDYQASLKRRLDEVAEGEPWREGGRLALRALEARAPASGHVRDEAIGRTWDFSATIVDDPAGPKVILIVREITRLVELQESLRRSETMSAMGALVAGVAHEVRNPLHAISTTVDAFQARFGGQGEDAPYFEVLRGEVKRLTALTRDLLEYGKASAPLFEDGDLREIVDQAMALCAPEAERAGVTIACDLPAHLPGVRMDPMRLSQVFVNLLQNAVQHSKRGARVTVLGAERAGWFECAVRDEGSSFRADDIAKVFQPFFSRRRGGTGLGLSIVRRIVEEHGGVVRAGNHEGGGGLVTVKLPLSRG